MKANELRIGNYVQYYENPFYAIEDGADIYAADIYHPIPLTEKWLLKFGFSEYIDFGTRNGMYDKIPLCGFSYHLPSNKVMIMQKGNSISHWLDIEIKYVHQLQNLYFALAGTELECKI